MDVHFVTVEIGIVSVTICIMQEKRFLFSQYFRFMYHHTCKVIKVRMEDTFWKKVKYMRTRFVKCWLTIYDKQITIYKMSENALYTMRCLSYNVVTYINTNFVNYGSTRNIPYMEFMVGVDRVFATPSLCLSFLAL